jgi:Predicted membrane protein (DUF2207) C-terminal domain/Predicted membrane protein (DUF2207) N-terminal domain
MIRRLLPALLVAMVLPASAAAQRTLTIQRFQSDLDVQRNGDVEVTETITARFEGSWNGIFRDLSLEHRTGQGTREHLDVDLNTITDSAGEPLRFETSRQGGWTRRFKIWVPGAENATRTVIVKYTVHNAIRFFDEGNIGPLDELYWNATGNGWEIPIERAGARVTLPSDIAPTQWSGYTGESGSRETDVDIERQDGTVAFEATRPFQPGEGLTVAVGWAPGVIPRPDPPGIIATAFSRFFPFVIPFGVFTLAFSAWRRNGKDPEEQAIQVMYEPPATLTPAEVGTLVDHKADMHDVTATLVDLAVRGYIHIEKREKKTLGIFSSSDYVFHLKKPRHEWRGLFEHEQLYLNALFKHDDPSTGGLMKLFGGGDDDMPDPGGAGTGETYDSVKLSTLKNRFYKDLSPIRKSIYTGLITKGHYKRNPENVKAMWIAFGIGAAVLTFLGSGFVSSSGFLGLEPGVVAVAGGVSAVLLFVFSQIMPARTVRGARTRESALGFKEFLSKVEEDRFKRMITSPEMFERYLPYAMAFKVEQRWSKAFEDMYREPPQWYSGYYGHSAFNVSSFTHDMSAMSTAASSTMSSSPSGSGGGGSSGGGSGGGGGGGF